MTFSNHYHSQLTFFLYIIFLLRQSYGFEPLRILLLILFSFKQTYKIISLSKRKKNHFSIFKNWIIIYFPINKNNWLILFLTEDSCWKKIKHLYPLDSYIFIYIFIYNYFIYYFILNLRIIIFIYMLKYHWWLKFEFIISFIAYFLWTSKMIILFSNPIASWIWSCGLDI